MHRCMGLGVTSDSQFPPTLKTRGNVPDAFLHTFAERLCPSFYLDTKQFRQRNKQVSCNKMPERCVSRQEFCFLGLELAT